MVCFTGFEKEGRTENSLPAIALEIIERRERAKRRIVAERLQEIAERLDRQPGFADRLTEGDEHGMRRHAAQAVVEALLPAVEARELLGSRQVAVGDVVGEAGVRVDRREMPPLRARQEKRADEEILGMRARQACAVAECEIAIDGRRQRYLVIAGT